MADINEAFERMIAEMQRYGAAPAPSKGGSYNNMLRYREAREKILDRFLAAFAEGYRLGKEGANVDGKDNNAPTKEQSGSLTCEGCIHEENEHENCNYCVRASYLGDYYYRRPPERQED